VVGRDDVEAALRLVWDDPAAELVDFHVELIPGTSPARGGVYRIDGTGRTRGELRPRRLVLKVLRPLPEDLLDRVRERAPADFDAIVEAVRWDREALAYRSGLLADLAPGLVAARCYRLEERPDDGFWLWLEDVGDGHDRWTVDDFARAAHHLGRFNGAYVVGRPLPDFPWLSRDSLWPHVRFLAAESWAAVSSPNNWRSPLARAVFPSPPIDRFARLRDDLELFGAALRRLPQTFCHHDAHQDNLFFRAEGMAAIDWQVSGLGAVGEELGHLVGYCMKLYALPGARIGELDRAVFDGYVEGLRAAGWGGDAGLARLGYLASFVPRMAMNVPQLNLLADEARLAAVGRRRGLSPIEIARHHAAITHYLLDLADEARGLIATATPA
jgi:hypothetical protein